MKRTTDTSDTTPRAGGAAGRVLLGLGAGIAIVGMLLGARRVAQASADLRDAEHACPGPSADSVDCAEMIDNALMARLAIKARFAQEAHAIDHDLRGPVGAMAVALELLRTADDAATRDEVAEVLQRQVARMTTLTQRVHDLAQQLAD
jgi:signal transduction histidine kinase